MKLKKRIQSSQFFETLKIIKKQPKLFFQAVLFDVLFLASLYGISKLVSFSIPADTSSITAILQSPWLMLSFALISSALYYLFILFIYSFFKYNILDIIKSMFGKTKFSFRRLGSFFLLNILIAALLFAVFISINLIVSPFIVSPFIVIKILAAILFFVMIVPFIFFSYPLINITHSLFEEGSNIKDSLKKGFKITFGKIKSYAAVYLHSIIVFVIYIVLFYIFGLILKYTLFRDLQAYAGYYPIYVGFFNITATILLFLIIAFNRIYFYNAVRKVSR